MGIVQLRRNIIYPFTTPVSQLVVIKKLFGPTDAEKEAKAKLTDTDGDGLSDWDEENFYHTSPYNTDTDSDGIPDNTEIARRTDPSCPQGQNCGYVYTPPSASGLLGLTGSDSSASSSQAYGSPLPLVPERSATSVRAYLKAQGVSDAQLSSYTDEMLLQAYDQSVQDFKSSSSTPSAIASTSTSASSPAALSPTTQGSIYSQ